MCVIPEKNRLISNYLSILFGVLCLLSGQAVVCSILVEFVAMTLKIERVKLKLFSYFRVIKISPANISLLIN